MVAILLLFVSSVVTMAQDIKSVNAFLAEEKSGSSNSTTSNSQLIDSDYIEGSTVPNQPAGAFWAVLNRLLIIFQAIFLFISETDLLTGFFDAYFPILGSKFGTGALGVIQCLLGAAVLSHHVDEFSLVSAFFLFSLGCLNILVGLVYREKAKLYRYIFKFPDDEDVLDGVATSPRTLTLATGDPEKGLGASGAVRSGSTASSASGKGFGRQATKEVAMQGYTLRKPEESVPPYAPKPARPESNVSNLSSPSQYTSA